MNRYGKCPIVNSIRFRMSGVLNAFIIVRMLLNSFLLNAMHPMLSLHESDRDNEHEPDYRDYHSPSVQVLFRDAACSGVPPNMSDRPPPLPLCNRMSRVRNRLRIPIMIFIMMSNVFMRIILYNIMLVSNKFSFRIFLK